MFVNYPAMAPKPDKDFVARFCAATKRARENAKPKLTMQAISDKLGIPWRTYQKYEKSSPMPPHLIINFCLHTGIHILDLFAPPPQKKSD